MQTNILTVEDLEDFKQTLLVEIRKMILEMGGTPQGKYLKTHEVRKMLKISQGSLQNLRLQGKLPFVKLGGIFYYQLDDVNAMMQNLREVSPASPFSFEKRSNAITKSKRE